MYNKSAIAVSWESAIRALPSRVKPHPRRPGDSKVKLAPPEPRADVTNGLISVTIEGKSGFVRALVYEAAIPSLANVTGCTVRYELVFTPDALVPAPKAKPPRPLSPKEMTALRGEVRRHLGKRTHKHEFFPPCIGSEIRQLTKKIDDPGPHRARAQVVLAVAKGSSVSQAAHDSGRDHKWVGRWVRRFEDHGIAGLEDGHDCQGRGAGEGACRKTTSKF